MQHFKSNRRTGGFTMVEMLVVIAIIGILAALLLPALTGSKKRAKRIVCETQLQQIGIGFQSFAHDHNSKFPMQVSTNDGGAQEYFQGGNLLNGFSAYRNFQSLGGILATPNILVCPADTRVPAANFITLQNSNVSYFAGLNASYDQPMSILAGDGNLTTSATATIVVGTAGSRLAWNKNLHEFKGNVLFSDGHVEEWKDGAGALASTVTIALPTGGGSGTGGGGGGAGSGGMSASAGSGSRGDGGGDSSVSSAVTPNAAAATSRIPQGGAPTGPSGNPAPEATERAMLPSRGRQNITWIAPEQIETDVSNSVAEVSVVTNDLPDAQVSSPVDDHSTMSPANQTAASVMRGILGGGYLVVLLLVLAYAAYRFRRWRQEVERKRRLKEARARTSIGSQP